MARWTDVAEWRGPTPNVGGRMIEQRGLVIHIAEGSYEGTIAWQKNRSANVSSHFVIGLDGTIAQVVDTDVIAWTQILGNGHWLSVENAGHTPNALTDAQVEANARLFAKVHLAYGVPLQLATSPSGRGLGHHSMGAESGINWGHSECPGPAIKAQKPAILARAIEIVNGDEMTPDDIKLLLDSPIKKGGVSVANAILAAGASAEKAAASAAQVLAAVKEPQAVTTEAIKAALADPVVLATIAKAVADETASRLKA